MISTITVNPSIDQHIIVDGLAKDDANRARAIFRYAGGKGVNVSKVVRELGGRTHAYALIGGAPGEFWKELIVELDIPFTAAPVDGDTRINTILTDEKDGTQTRISAPGPYISPARIERFTEKLLKVRKPFLWALGGSLSYKMKPSTYRDMIHRLQKTSAPCILDTDDEPLRLGIEAKPFMIKPNEFEMQRLFNRPFKTIHDYLGGAQALVKKGVRIVIVSLGSKGALFVTDREAFHVLTPKVPVKSKVGAGDSLIGGFAWGLCKKMSLKEAAKLGIAASTSAVMREAPRLCLRKDIAGIVKRIKIRSL